MNFNTRLFFWGYLLFAFIAGSLTTCSIRIGQETQSSVQYVVPADKSKEAAELYAKVYAAAMNGRAESDAKKAVITVYGQPVTPKF